jgi:hypothetical protein
VQFFGGTASVCGFRVVSATWRPLYRPRPNAPCNKTGLASEPRGVRAAWKRAHDSHAPPPVRAAPLAFAKSGPLAPPITPSLPREALVASRTALGCEGALSPTILPV